LPGNGFTQEGKNGGGNVKNPLRWSNEQAQKNKFREKGNIRKGSEKFAEGKRESKARRVSTDREETPPDIEGLVGSRVIPAAPRRHARPQPLGGVRKDKEKNMWEGEGERFETDRARSGLQRGGKRRVAGSSRGNSVSRTI